MGSVEVNEMRQTVTPLDPREERFIALYVENPNGTQAAIAAGYAPKGAHVTASRLLKRAKIKEAIAKRNAEIMAKYDFTPDRIIRELAKIAAVNLEDFIAKQDDGSVIIDFSTATREQMAGLAGIDVEEYTEGRGENARGVKKIRVKPGDKKGALVELAKLARMYPAERTEVTGADGGPITAVTLNASQHKIDIEGMTLEERAQLKQTLLMLKAKRESETEPPRVFRRLCGLSHAAMAG